MPQKRIREESSTSTPVRMIPSDARARGPEAGMGLCLSGGGYRAMLFHLGALWRLNEAGMLREFKRISSVSGGSITAGVLARAWKQLNFDTRGVGVAFGPKVVDPIRKLSARTIDTHAIIGGALLPGTIGDKLTNSYRRYLFEGTTLQDLPDEPRFVFNATSVQSGVLWRFSKPYMADYRVGMVPNPKVELAVVVAASSAFPPVLSPVELELDPREFRAESGLDLQEEPYTSQVVLTDGGVYDNLGLETVWKRYKTVLISDGGGLLTPEADPKRDWGRHSYRVLNIIHNQVTALRKRQAIQSFIATDDEHNGTYWGINSQVADYHLDDALPCPEERTVELAATPTRLKRLEPVHQKRLINWGYAICDTAVRKYVKPTLTRPSGFPYPDVEV